MVQGSCQGLGCTWHPRCFPLRQQLAPRHITRLQAPILLTLSIATSPLPDTQSYGSRYVRPPIIHGDIAWRGPMTVREWRVAQDAACTGRPVKGMLTGPVTILNWSFPRKDVTRRVQALQLALALRSEVDALQQAGCKVVQVSAWAQLVVTLLSACTQRRGFLLTGQQFGSHGCLVYQRPATLQPPFSLRGLPSLSPHLVLPCAPCPRLPPPARWTSPPCVRACPSRRSSGTAT